MVDRLLPAATQPAGTSYADPAGGATETRENAPSQASEGEQQQNPEYRSRFSGTAVQQTAQAKVGHGFVDGGTRPGAGGLISGVDGHGRLVVAREVLTRAMRAELALNKYDATKSANWPRFLAAVSLGLGREAAHLDPQGPPLVFHPEDWVAAYAAATGLSRDGLPELVRLAEVHQQHIAVQYATGSVVEGGHDAGAVKSAVNVAIWFPEAVEASSYSYVERGLGEDLQSEVERWASLRVVDLGDRRVISDVEGLNAEAHLFGPFSLNIGVDEIHMVPVRNQLVSYLDVGIVHMTALIDGDGDIVNVPLSYSEQQELAEREVDLRFRRLDLAKYGISRPDRPAPPDWEP